MGFYFGIGLIPFLTQAQNLNFPVHNRILQSLPPLRATGMASVRVTEPPAHVVIPSQLPYEVTAVPSPHFTDQQMEIQKLIFFNTKNEKENLVDHFKVRAE